jgi:glycosyltransferase involved in cell wall biosynthesis
MSTVPRVSICLPAYNGGAWIEQAIGSALAQTLEDFELIVSDNASTDDTYARAAAFEDARIRIVRSDRNEGPTHNVNRCIELARAPLVKFLHADDELYPRCLEAMVPVLDESPRVGLVFSPRDVVLDEPDEEEARSWYDRYHTLHEPLGELDRVTNGRQVFRRWLELGVHDNLIGEPSAVLVRRECFERLGPFSPRLQVSTDIEMWLRILLHYDVGFVPEPLCAYRHHASSLTGVAYRTSSGWLDDLWILESLLQHDLDPDEQRLVRRARSAELRRVVRGVPARAVHRNLAGAGLRQYLGHRLRTARAA